MRKSKVRLDNRGMGRKELMLVIVIILGVTASLLWKVTTLDDNRELKEMKELWVSYGNVSAALRDSSFHYEKIVYLNDVIKSRYASVNDFKSPASSEEQCDPYETKMIMDGGTKLVSIKCGEYLIPLTTSRTDSLFVYKVGKWTDKVLVGDNVEEKRFYNYKIDDKEVFENYYIEKKFLEEYNKKNETNIISIDQIDKEANNIVTKTYYRTKEFIEEV